MITHDHDAAATDVHDGYDVAVDDDAEDDEDDAHTETTTSITPDCDYAMKMKVGDICITVSFYNTVRPTFELFYKLVF